LLSGRARPTRHLGRSPNTPRTALRYTTHGVYAGIRVPFGAAEPSLREQDRTTGLGLASHYYGKFLPH